MPTPSQPPRQIDFKWLPIDLIVVNTWNPNKEDDITFNLLKDEIAAVGMIDPIEVVPMEDGTYQIIGGEHRWRAAKELGHEELPCILLTDEKWREVDLRKFCTVRLNMIKGKLDPEKFLALYKEMSTKYGEEPLQRLFAFTDQRALQKQLGWVKKNLKQTLPPEMASEIEERTKDAKSMEDLGNIVQDLYNKFGETLQQSFMFFTYGKQTHLFIQMDAKMRRSVQRLTDACQLLGQDINEVFRPIVNEAVKRASIEIEKKKQEEAIDTIPPVVFDKQE